MRAVLFFAAASALAALVPATALGRFAPCPTDQTAPALPRADPPVHADVDGDGAPDQIWIAYKAAAPAECGIYLIVRRSRGGLVATRLPAVLGGTADFSIRQVLPKIYGVFRLGASPARQIVIIVDRGAHAVSFAIYGLRAGALRSLEIEGRDWDVVRWDAGLLDFGDVDCRRSHSGPLLSELYADGHSGPQWSLSQHVWRLVGSRFELVRSLDLRRDHASVVTFARSYGEASFAHCRGVRAR